MHLMLTKCAISSMGKGPFPSWEKNKSLRIILKKMGYTEFPGLLESRKGGKQFQRTEKRQKTEAVRPPLEHLDDECKFDNAPSSRLCVPVLSKLCFAKARAPSSI